MPLRRPRARRYPDAPSRMRRPTETPTMPNASAQPATPATPTEPEAFSISFRSKGGPAVGGGTLRRGNGSSRAHPARRCSKSDATSVICKVSPSVGSPACSRAARWIACSPPPSRSTSRRSRHRRTAGLRRTSSPSTLIMRDEQAKSRTLNGRDASNAVPFSPLLEAITDTMARVRHPSEWC